MSAALSSRLHKLERRHRAARVDPLLMLPPCLADWRRGAGPAPPFKCTYRLLWRYYSITTTPRPTAEVRREVGAIGPLLFDYLAAWEPGLPLRDVRASADVLLAGNRAWGWLCLLKNIAGLVDCLQIHRESSVFNGDLSVPNGAHGHCMLAGTVSMLMRTDLTEVEKADPFFTPWPCHPWP